MSFLRVLGLAALAARAAALLPSPVLPGDLFYGTCNLPACSTLEFAAFNLSTQASTDLFDFPTDEFEDGYVADDVLIQSGGSTEVVISLQYDNATSRGYLATFDLARRALVGGVQSPFCFALYLDPAQPAGSTDSLLCLSLGAPAPCGATTQCTYVSRVSRTTGAVTQLSVIMPDYCPFTVDALDPVQGVIFSTFEECSGAGGPLIATIDARTGAVKSMAHFAYTLAFIEFEYRAKDGRIYAVVQDSSNAAQPVAYLGTVDPATATPTPLGPAAYYNVSFPPATGGFINQFNTISTISEDAGAFFFTAFHYAIPGPPPSDPILHLIGSDLTTGALVYDAVVANPFCEILWVPSA